MRPTVTCKLRAAETALAERRALYPALVEQGLMSPEHAAREIAAMEAIVEEYRIQVLTAEVA